MKRVLLFLAVCAACISLGGCSKSISPDDEGAGVFPKSFYAFFEQEFTPGNDETKAYLDESNNEFIWENEDQIVVNGATYQRKAYDKFEYSYGGFTSAPGSDFVALYPVDLYSGGTSANSCRYSLQRAYSWNTSTKKVNFVPQAGKSNDSGEIKFKNLGSLFKINLTNTSRNTIWLKSITFSSDKTMSGEFSLAFNDGGIPQMTFTATASRLNSVELRMDNPVEMATNVSYTTYMPVPSQDYGVFNVKVTAYSAAEGGDDKLISYVSSAVKAAGQPQSVDNLECERAKLYSFNIKANSFVAGSLFSFDDESNVYLIQDANGLKWLADQVALGNDFSGMTVSLASDINVGGITLTPIGSESHPFRGKVDGAGHTISNFVIDSNGDNAGLFGYVVGDISNVEITNATVSGVDTVGVLVGRIEGNIENCVVTKSTVTGENYVGALAGKVIGNLTDNVVSEVTVAASNNNAGGLAGAASGDVTGNVVKDINVEGVDNLGGAVGNLISGNVDGNSVTSSEILVNRLADGSPQTTPNADTVVGKVDGGTVGTNAVSDSQVDTLEFVGNNLNVSSGRVWPAIARLVSSGEDMDGKTITLTADIDLTDALVGSGSLSTIGTYEEGTTNPFKGTLDGGDHIISGLYQNGWDLGYDYYYTGGSGLFGAIENATIKNVKIKQFESYVEGGLVAAVAGFAKGQCTFNNISIEDSKFGTYNNAIGSVVAYCDEGTFVFEDITIGSDVVVAGMWGSFDQSCGGLIGEIKSSQNTTVTITNTTIAARVDAYNDIMASYQYGNYRMCGMIVGWIHQTQTIEGAYYPDPAAAGVSCSGVVVNYGSWMNYHYCKLYNGGGRNYSRVEPGYQYGGVSEHAGHVSCNELWKFDQIFGGGQYNVKGLTSFSGVTVNYPSE